MFAPVQILVELTEHYTDKNTADEMVFAVEWAEKNNVDVGFFNTDFSVLKNVDCNNDVRYQELVAQEISALAGVSWKETNQRNFFKKEPFDSISNKLEQNFVDTTKSNRREQLMLKNIKKMRSTEGTVVILTGAGHLDFFEKNLSEAEMPLRTSV